MLAATALAVVLAVDAVASAGGTTPSYERSLVRVRRSIVGDFEPETILVNVNLDGDEEADASDREQVSQGDRGVSAASS